MVDSEVVPSEAPLVQTPAIRAPALRATVDLMAIAYNVGVLKQAVGAAEVMAIVKAKGYGHGAVEAALASLAGGASELGVATIEEALALRRAGITAPIACWVHSYDSDFVGAIEANIELGVSSPEYLALVVAAARSLGVPATVSLKVDTGLNRNGVAPEEWDATVAGLAVAIADGAVIFRALFSHLAFGDHPAHPVNDKQAEMLRELATDLARRGLPPQILHLANSGTALTRPDLAFDLVRPGIAVYGRTPIPPMGDFGLIPAMSLDTSVVLTKKLTPGDGVSYGHSWIADQPTVVGLLSMGYADGLPRGLSNNFEVMINGRRFPSVGRVCMDQVVVDLGADGGGVHTGDRAILFGNGSDGEPTVLEWAERLNTIDYELLTGIRGRTILQYRGAEELGIVLPVN